MTNVPELSPVDDFGHFTVKREDLVAWQGLKYPSGSKVRQYAAMAAAAPGVPMIVGCSANSCMQIYVAAAAHLAKVPGIIYVPRRKERTAATEYALDLDAKVYEVPPPAYRSVYLSRARERAASFPAVVRWDVTAALHDAAAQCKNIPRSVKRIVVATGSGLTAAGVLAGFAGRLQQPVIVAITVSDLADVQNIMLMARRITNKPLPVLELIKHTMEYDEPHTAALPDDTPLDPFYGAKALAYLERGDCLWLPGLRPVCSMPVTCQAYFRDWKGPRK